ncbi:MAG: outer membrane protein assembly factor BamE [Alphaproteobacteria bacterium]|nr:outer membrane protein assembly factor BamE [Alphaproteobacteria bacterium]
MSGILQILRVGSTCALMTVIIMACDGVKKVDNRGYIATKPVAESIVEGKTTRAEVRELLGSPSTVSSYPPETWYYISRERQTVAFLAPKLKKQKVAQIEFDADGRVSKFEHINEAAARDMEYVDRKTPTEGRSLGLMEQLLGNLGRFNTPRDSTQSRQ